MYNAYHDLRSWFDTYTASFKNDDIQLSDAVQLKYAHTLRVGNEIEALCESLNLDASTHELAKIAALFHDVARFEQFRIYRTFSDARSENHAEMGVTLLREHEVLRSLEPEAQKAVLVAISYHNAVVVPSDLTQLQLLLCRLLRDADKLDIYQIALDYYSNPDPLRRETVQIGIPDGCAVSPEICKKILLHQIVPYEQIKTVSDFKMIQIGWVYDLNFDYSLQCVKKRGYINKIQRLLQPLSPDVQKVIAAVEQYLESNS